MHIFTRQTSNRRTSDILVHKNYNDGDFIFLHFFLWQAARNVGLKVLQCAEDDDFMAAFDKMMSETLQVGRCCSTLDKCKYKFLYLSMISVHMHCILLAILSLLS